MSLKPQPLPEIPEETARVARSLLPKGNRYMWLRDELGAIYTDEQFARLYPTQGQCAEQPWRLAFMCMVQYLENYTDRQTAEAMKTRIDLKYALSLELTDPGFDFSVLSEFRSRLIKGGEEERLLTAFLERCQEHGWLKERGKQRTDSTHIEAAIRVMNQIECVGETLRAALNSLAIVVPDWLRVHVPADWFDRYARRMEDFRMPKEAKQREALAEQIGQDGWDLFSWIREDETFWWLRNIPAVEILRKVWVQQFWVEEGQLHLRSKEHLPPASLLIASPYDPQARMAVKRSTSWIGYKAHLTETCDDDLPHLIIHVETTPAPTADRELTEELHQKLDRKQLLPDAHLMDAGYLDGGTIVTSQKAYGIDLIGPVQLNSSWQAKAAEGFDSSQFRIDWEHQVVTCPQGKTSQKWFSWVDEGVERIGAQFGKEECLSCPTRSQCTHAKTSPRKVTFSPREEYEALQAVRQRQNTPEFKKVYAKRAGIEGTISQGVRAFDLRVCRYLGREKAHVQHLLTATAMNVVRLFQWYMGDAPAKPRISHFAALAL